MTNIQLQKINAQQKLSTTPYLGLVCITSDQEVRFRTITRTRYLKLSLQQREDTLRELYQHNLQCLNGALSFCQKQNIRLYRMTSALFPLSDMEDEIGANILEEMSADLGKIGQIAQTLGIRMVLHPDQFVVLSSESSEVVETSIKILARHARTLDLLGLPQSPWALMNIHGGKSQRAEKLVKVISELPPGIKNRLTLENDEYSYNANDILAVCQQANIPMVFDAHHHICYEKLDTYNHPSVESALLAARETWLNPDWQLVHISNGDSGFNDRKHSHLITAMPDAYYQAPWIEVEAKHKEKAIAHLQNWWLIQNN
ncbi:UV DNA damage repair endonuclease UvsE [Anabaena cylindrica FACHB-243]|uniref:UV-damage endonuclease n=1 Tax=Anabaena cylindrica (strain ATCC 27899 / PCC 7122) TaxID=272123 RepID=K9Z9E7_ANACC|nr:MULTISPECIES: UV DNA damage repair endonuclease UvsE [Anabaena]AFZ55818.1 UV-damage endonuclease [Anabaena cylindrica PCC 7122]MBD2421241.1 UV DNA damage repair endonuclease UvsE [Anabaena cylindrica FACHB-243]MBY5284144.1 UV DNA damage repair endonuclease UvsE [Anabaena sp. CCAP 1446/1C]MBY5308072.1 UV DNA damage repair endonuclease UvsE [Anabaena sp. CCAP 1446/1C]MCM2406572.1 UV DNA damage repair endonuclease UvsE [Anabaena sp. CCAP 1446/1C]